MDGVVVVMNKKNELKTLLKIERKTYFGEQRIRWEHRFRKQMKYEMYRYMSLLRKYEYFCTMRDTSRQKLKAKYWAMRVKVCDRLKNKQGLQLGIEITPNCAAPGVRICHQNVILNGYVGTGCVFHGNNVIGNKKTGAASEVPTLGANVDVGVGAIVIGNVTIADDCIIGAGSVVTKSFLEPGTIIAGVPAKAIGTVKET